MIRKSKKKTPVKFYALNKHIDFKKEKNKTNSRKDSTEAYCCGCKKKFVLPFRPRNPEVYCDECFKNKNNKRDTEEKEFKLNKTIKKDTKTTVNKFKKRNFTNKVLKRDTTKPK